MREARRRTFPQTVQTACLCARVPLASHDSVACHRLIEYSDHLTSKDQTRGYHRDGRIRKATVEAFAATISIYRRSCASTLDATWQSC
jgi:hypothetical protein